MGPAATSWASSTTTSVASSVVVVHGVDQPAVILGAAVGVGGEHRLADVAVIARAPLRSGVGEGVVLDDGVEVTDVAVLGHEGRHVELVGAHTLVVVVDPVEVAGHVVHRLPPGLARVEVDPEVGRLARLVAGDALVQLGGAVDAELGVLET